jgi:hypothetical protein
MSNTNNRKTYTEMTDAEKEAIDAEENAREDYKAFSETYSRKIEWAMNEMPVWCEGKSEAEIIAYVDKYDAEQEVLAQAEAALAKANAFAADDVPF